MTFHGISLFVTSKIIPLALSIIGFGLLIVVHELGHFLFCKAFGIHTPTFSIGFGPKIVEKKIGSTNFRIAKIPLGGYVEIAGLAEPGQGEQEHAKAAGDDSFGAKPYWQKFLVLTGGILFNLVFALLAFCTIFMIGDIGKKQVITITHIAKDSPAQHGGLLEKDEVLSINGQTLTPESGKTIMNSLDFFLQIIKDNPEKPLSLTVLRGKEKVNLSITPKKTIVDNVAIGRIGIVPSVPMPRLPFIKAIKEGFYQTSAWVGRIVGSFKHLFAKKSLEGVGGPVMIVAQGFKHAGQGIISLLLFLAIISISLAIINLLPLGITDGGQLVLTTIEAIIRRPIPDAVRIAINLVSVGLFAVLFIYLTYKDIIRLFGASFIALYKKIVVLFGK